MGIKAIGDRARLLIEQLAAERDAAGGKSRFLLGGTVQLDSVQAWTGQEAKVDGSEIEAVYRAYRKPTGQQIREASSAKAAGVDLQFAKGRIIDVKKQEDGSVLLLVTNGARGTNGKIPYRAFNVNKGHLYALSIGESLGMTADEARVLADGLDKEEEKAPVTEPSSPSTPAEAIQSGPLVVQNSGADSGVKTPTAHTGPEAPATTPAPELLKLAEAVAELARAVTALLAERAK